MIGFARVLIGFDWGKNLNLHSKCEILMTKTNKKTVETKKSKGSARQRKARVQQVLLAVIGIVVILSMVLALTLNF